MCVDYCCFSVVVCLLADGLFVSCVCFFFFQAEDGIRDAQESRGLGDVYKRQFLICTLFVCCFGLLNAQLLLYEDFTDYNVDAVLPVSYTHLTLPTIYSV